MMYWHRTYRLATIHQLLWCQLGNRTIDFDVVPVDEAWNPSKEGW
jgi:hypothetical protein